MMEAHCLQKGTGQQQDTHHPSDADGAMRRTKGVLPQTLPWNKIVHLSCQQLPFRLGRKNLGVKMFEKDIQERCEPDV